jgi:putative tryptophan/tyrosine transport system substrate-binding protein
MGLVDSFSRPGGNLTGVSLLVSLLGPKRSEVLLELVPNARTISLLVDPENPNIRADVPEAQQAAQALGRHLEVLTASTENELDAAFTNTKADALLVMPDPYFNVRRHQLVALTARHAMPAIVSFPRVRRHRRPDKLRESLSLRRVSPNGHASRKDSEGRQAGRSPYPTEHQG